MVTALDQLAGKHVLFLNWRDRSHPEAGGAEAYCHEIARRWTHAGVRVTLFSSRYPGAAGRASSDGVSIRRAGGTFGVYPAGALHLWRHVRDYDADVDFQNGVPYFSPLFAGRWRPNVCVIHHVHQDQFDLRFRWPLNVVGRTLEKEASRLVYRGRPIVVVSPSTREAVRRRLGFRNSIYLVPNGAPSTVTPVERSGTPTIAIVNRLAAHKRIDLLLKAIPALLHRWSDLHVDIAGDGNERERLHGVAARLDLGTSVEFHGYVEEARKRVLLARAWLTVVPSSAEGWGLAVAEANSVGTPALAFDVPGLRDAIQPGLNGWLLPAGTELAEGIGQALDRLTVETVRERMARQCLAWSGRFSWDASAMRLAEVLLVESQRVERRRKSRRSLSDLAVLVELEGTAGHDLERMAHASLRRTDTIIRAGNTFRLMLDGCDEVLGLRVLRRLGAVEAATIRLAKRAEVLERPTQFPHGDR